MITDKCTICLKFIYCEKSHNEYRIAKSHFPGDRWEDGLNRAEWMADKFQNCNEFQNIGDLK